MAYKIYQYHNGKKTDISAISGTVTWQESLDSLGGSFSIPFAKSYWDKSFKHGIYNGDKIVIKNGTKELFRGIVTTRPIGDGDVSGYDYAFYLNKSEVIIQYKNISAQKAIKQLCSRFNVPVGSVPNLKTSIKKIFKDKVVSDVIKEILKDVKSESGTSYKMEMRQGKLYIVKSGSTKITPKYTDELGRSVQTTKTAKISGQRSIEEMRNHVTYAGTSDKAKQVKAIAKSSASIKKYGLLADVETKDNLTTAKARNRAKNRLKSLNKISTTFTAEMRGADNVQSGRLLYFERPEVGLKGWYKIKSVTHTLNGQIHMVTCEMENR